jgi:branched-chain amino acid aminotransferase
MLVSLNGMLIAQEDAKVPAADRGFLYGDAVFETVAVYGGRSFRLDAHLDRLARSMQALRFTAPCEAAALRAEVARVLEANRLCDGIVRLCVTRGSGPRGLGLQGVTHPVVLVTAHAPALSPDQDRARAASGVALAVSTVRRVPPACLPAHAKHANVLGAVLAQAQAADAGSYEAVMLTTEGWLAECSFSNLFLVRGGALLTPALSLGILPGITRAAVIALAGCRGIAVEEGVFDERALATAEEVFVTNTSAGVLPASAIDGRPLPSVRPVTRALRDDYWRLVQAEAGRPWHLARGTTPSPEIPG